MRGFKTRVGGNLLGGYPMKTVIAAVALLCASAALHAQNVDPAPPPPSTYAAVMALEVPVVAGDITDRPYR